jgi:hypothetical protein
LKATPVGEVFESVKNLSYSIESMAEGFITEPSSSEFAKLSKLYLDSMETFSANLSASTAFSEEVVWAYGRRSSWLKWLCAARKNELELTKSRASKSLLCSTIEAHTVEMLAKVDWNLFTFCCSRRNWREAATTLARIFLESSVDVERVCKAFLNLKFSILTDTRMSVLDPSLTLFELAAKQLKVLELCSDAAFVAADGEDWNELAAFECKLYKSLDGVLFRREIEFLDGLANGRNVQDDDSYQTDSSCGSL